MSQQYFVVFLESSINGQERGIATLTGDKRLGTLDIWVPSLVGAEEYQGGLVDPKEYQRGLVDPKEYQRGLVDPKECQGVLVYHQGRARVPIKTGHFVSVERGFRLNWEFKPEDVGGTGLSIAEFGEILVTKETGQTGVIIYHGRLVTQKRAWQTACHKISAGLADSKP